MLKRFFQNLLDCFDVEYDDIIYEDEQSYTVQHGVGEYTLVFKDGMIKPNVNYIVKMEGNEPNA